MIYRSKLHSLGYISLAESTGLFQPHLRNRRQNTEFSEITQTIEPLRRSRSFKVTDYGTDRKPICDFLLVINTNLFFILHVPSYGRLFVTFSLAKGSASFNAIVRGDL